MRPFMLAIVAVMILAPAALAADKTLASEYPFFSRGPLAQSKLVDLPDGMIMRQSDKYGDIIITQDKIDEFIKANPPEFTEELKKNGLFILIQLVVKPLAAKEAYTAGFYGDSETVMENNLKKVASKVTVDDKEVKAFYEKNKESFNDEPFEKVADKVKAAALAKKQGEVRGNFLNALSERFEIELNAKWVKQQAASAMENPIDKARASGKPSFVNFGSQAVEASVKFEALHKEIERQYGAKMNVIAIDYEKNQVLSLRYGAKQFPLLLIYNDKGKEVFRGYGYMTLAEVEAELAKVGIK